MCMYMLRVDNSSLLRVILRWAESNNVDKIRDRSHKTSLKGSGELETFNCLRMCEIRSVSFHQNGGYHALKVDHYGCLMT